ncbi:MAG: hypothetical protein V4624_02540 [Pseudomonadota bacterium]
MKFRAIALVAALFSGSVMAAEPVGDTKVALGLTSGQLTALGVTVLVAGGAVAAANSNGASGTR